jgi:hypothetical protein
MTFRTKCFALALVSMSLASVISTAPAVAAAPRAVAPPADVAALLKIIQAAIKDAQSKFTPGESASDQEAAIQAAINLAIATSGYDAVTAQAALSSLANDPNTPVGQAIAAVLAVITPLAQQEIAQATATGAAQNGANGGLAAGSNTGSTSTGGYVVSQ